MEKQRTNVVYVNPNFSQKPNTNGGMHINPRFKGNLPDLIMKTHYLNSEQNKTQQQQHNIHVNPKVLQIAPSISNETAITSSLNKLPTQNTKYLVNNRNKIVKAATERPKLGDIVLVQKSKETTTPINKVIKKPAYSIVRKNTQKIENIKPKCDSIEKTCIVSNKAAQSNVWKKKESSQSITYSTYSLKRRKSLNNSLAKDKVKKIIGSKYKLDNKSSRQSLNNTKSTVIQKYSLKINKPSITTNVTKSVFIGGEKYVLNNNMLQKIVKTKSPNQTATSKPKKVKKINVGGVTYVRKSDNMFVMDNRMKNAMKKRKKINITCPTFRRIGLCQKHSEGKCPLVHDPKNISICQNFLKGICNVDECHLSHQVVKEKMPTCKFFLEGCCTKENCPYLHVKLNDSAKICQQFLNGFCELGSNCINKHLRVCPAFYKNSKCDKIKCPYPHKIIPKAKDLELLAQYSCLKTENYKYSNDKVIVGTDLKENNDSKKLRYFEESDASKSIVRNKNENVSYKGRPKLGDLPSYISLS